MEPSFLMKGLEAKDEKNDLVDVERLQWPSTPLSLQRQQQIANVRPELIAEILNDLIDYLKTSESYKSGKYIVMVPK